MISLALFATATSFAGIRQLRGNLIESKSRHRAGKSGLGTAPGGIGNLTRPTRSANMATGKVTAGNFKI
jgi:hypothetical protein